MDRCAQTKSRKRTSQREKHQFELLHRGPASKLDPLLYRGVTEKRVADNIRGVSEVKAFLAEIN